MNATNQHLPETQSIHPALAPQNFASGRQVNRRYQFQAIRHFLLTVILTLPFSAFAYLLQNQLPIWPVALAPTNPMTWVYFVAVIPVAIYLSVAVHEFGHALVAKLLGYRIVMVTVGMIGVANEMSGLNLRRIGTDLFALRGSTIALSTSPKYHRLREMAVLSGGIIAQLLLLWLLLQISALIFTPSNHPWLVAFVHSLALITFAGLCGSIIPIKVGQTETDAFQMWQMVRGGKNVDRRLQLQRLTAYSLAGMPYSALDKAELIQALAEEDGSRQEYAANLLAYLRASGRDDAAEALSALNKVLQYVHDNPAMRSATWPFLYAAEFELTHGRGAKAAMEWLALVQETDYSFLSLDFQQVKFRIKASILLAEGKTYQARHCLLQSLSLVERRIDRAAASVEKSYLNNLSTKLGVVPSNMDRAMESGSLFRYKNLLLPTARSLIGFAVMCVIFSAG